MKNKKCFLFLFLLLSSFIFIINNSHFRNVQANPIPVNSKIWKHIGLLPLDQNVNISIVEANVILDIDATTYKKFEVNTTAEYMFFNHNETTTITVILPIDTSSLYAGAISSDIDFNVNGIKIDYLILELTDEENENIHYLARTVIATNITFTGFSNTSINYSSFSQFKRNTGSTYVEIYYLVSTGYFWYGNITETVKFNVYGLQPDFYQNNIDNLNTFQCIVNDISNGQSYYWEWINHNLNFVFDPTIFYSSSDPRFMQNYGIYTILGFMMVLAWIAIIITIIIQRKK